MFENDDNSGLDLDDEFLNVVFEDEELFNNNKLPIHRRSTPGSSISLNIESPATGKLLQEKRIPNDHSFISRDSPSRKLENYNDGCQENKRKSSTPLSRPKRERKFPGPAGLLPERKSSRHTPLKLDKLPEPESPTVTAPEELCSQGQLSGSTLTEGPWQSFLADLGPHANMLDEVNVSSVKRKAAARCFMGNKVPLLAAVLHHLDVSSADPCIILRDTTGEIHGTLHREVWQQFAAELVVGSVLVVKNVGLLSTGLSSRRHYLNITANNLATIYSANPDKPIRKEVCSLTPYDYVKTVEHWRTLAAPPRESEPLSATTLFNTSLPLCSSSPAQTPSRPNGLKPPGVPQTHMRPNLQNNRPPLTQAYQNTKQSKHSGTNFSPYCQSKSISPSGNQNPSSARNTLNNSFPSHSSLKPNSLDVRTVDYSFKFDPVVLRTPSVQTNPSARLFNTSVGNSIDNSPRIILSQSSQLSVEDRSVVESVFEGIDADSLFDDDF